MGGVYATQAVPQPRPIPHEGVGRYAGRMGWLRQKYTIVRVRLWLNRAWLRSADCLVEDLERQEARETGESIVWFEAPYPWAEDANADEEGAEIEGDE